MISSLLTTAVLLVVSSTNAQPAEAPPVQRPVAAEPTATPPAAEPAPATPTEVTVEPEPEVAPEPEPEPEPEVAPEPEPEPSTDASADPDAAEVLRVATERDGPPFYTEADLAKMRERHGVESDTTVEPKPARWRCLIPDPTCRNTVELQAMGAYAMRARQGDVSESSADRWHSARSQYDVWLGLPALVETEGKQRYTRISLGPKGGVAFSDSGDLWGNVGLAMRYWIGRGRWAPHIEVTSALSFKLGTRVANDVQEERFRMQRGPVGFQADIGFGLGGFGSIVLGGQYDSPLAREEVPEPYRVVASGMFYVGFRGNILWGAPAAVAVGAHAATRGVNRP